MCVGEALRDRKRKNTDMERVCVYVCMCVRDEKTHSEGSSRLGAHTYLYVCTRASVKTKARLRWGLAGYG